MKPNLLFYSAFLFLAGLVFSTNKLTSQSTNYTVESFQGTYSELVSYESIALITGFDPLWTYEFELNFPFPYYGAMYNSLIFDRSGWGYFFEEDQDLSLSLMGYYSWTYDPWMGTNDIDSDARFAHVTIGGLQALVIQFTKARIFADPFEDSLDTYLNFQVWLIENGVIEVRFGEINMDGNPIYKAGKGVYCHTSDEGIDTTEVCGPLMSIANPFDESDAIGIEGAYNDYEVTGKIHSNFTVMPPTGWVIRFKPISVSVFSPGNDINPLIICPNPSSDNIYLSEMAGDVIVYNANGMRVIQDKVNAGVINISNLSKGIYTVQFFTEGSVYTGKFIKS